MKKGIVGVVIALVAIGAVVGVVVANNTDDNKATNSAQTSTPSTSNQSSNSSELSNNDNSSNSNSVSSKASEASVEISNFNFSPATLTIKKGTKVTWTNKDDVDHNVAPDSESDNFEGSELLSKGQSYSFTFDTPGTYTYHCTPHPQMQATIIVTE